MRVPVSYELDPNYPLLESLYGKKDAIKILQSGIPINRPSVVPSLQVPSESGSGCNPLSLGATSMGKARVSVRGLGPGLGAARGPCDPSPMWCDYVPFDGMFDDCKPIDPLACQQSQFGPAMTAANQAAAIKAGDEAVAAYCRQFPAECDAFNNAKDTELLQKGLLIGGGLLVLVMALR